LLARRQHDRRAGGGARPGDRLPDAAARPGDQRDLPLQVDLHDRHRTERPPARANREGTSRRRGQPPSMGEAPADTVGTVGRVPPRNRLAAETSPYLRQHADNPVDWYPWGDEAFAEARRRDVPVLLSVGYSSCHWCHVMAHESFEDPEVAALMNDLFVNVKV